MVAFPLLLIPLAIFNIIVLMMPGLSLAQPLTSIALKSGAIWSVTSGDVLLALATFLLMIEMIKAARPAAKSIVEMFLAILLCGGAVAEFVLLPSFATSVFFLLVVMTVIDVLGSLAIGAQSRRRLVRHTVVASSLAASRAEPAPKIEPVIVAPTESVEPKPDVMQEQAMPQDNVSAEANTTDTSRRSPYSPDGVPIP